MRLRKLASFGRIAPVAAALLIGGVALSVTKLSPVLAADHNDPHRVQSDQFWNTTSTEGADPAADIADLFAWNKLADPSAGPNRETDSLVVVLTWRVDMNHQTKLDPTVRYGIHVDTKGDIFSKNDSEADFDIWIRHGQDPATGAWGIKIENLPGTSRPVIGKVGTPFEVTLEDGGHARILSGLFDDPFVFDFDGFFYGLSVGLGNDSPDQIADPDLRDTRNPAFMPRSDRPFGFNNQNDTIAGVNVHGVVIEMPLRAVLAKTDIINVWATSSRPKGGSK